MTLYVVAWAQVAVHDLERIVDFIIDEAPLNARKVVARIERAAASLATLPTRGRVVPELRWHGIDRYQELQVPPWRLVYRVEREEVIVLAVLDSRRGLEDLLLERFLSS